MLRSIASKVAWVGRTASMVFGLALVLALLFGAASAVSAHTGNTGFFHLGHKNVSQAVSTLVGEVATGSSLVVRNPSGGSALDLRVQYNGPPVGTHGYPTPPPMKVNSDIKVTNLNSDWLDGKDSSDFQQAGAAAGGDLSGNYPEPTLAEGVVTPSNFGTIPTARVYSPVSQFLPSHGSVFTRLQFGQEEFDAGDLHSNSANNSRLTAPIDGVYDISATVNIDEAGAGGAGTRSVVISKNGSVPNILTIDEGPPTANDKLDNARVLSTHAKLSAGDFVEVFVFQDSGVTLKTARPITTHFEMTWIAPG